MIAPQPRTANGFQKTIIVPDRSLTYSRGRFPVCLPNPRGSIGLLLYRSGGCILLTATRWTLCGSRPCPAQARAIFFTYGSDVFRDGVHRSEEHTSELQSLR